MSEERDSSDKTVAKTRYFSRGEWFDKGTECWLIDDYRGEGLPSGLFLGTRNSKPDEEVCTFDEFEIVDG